MAMAAAAGAVASAIPMQNAHSVCPCIASNCRSFQGLRVSSSIAACAKNSGAISSTSASATALTEPSSTEGVASTASVAPDRPSWRASIDFKWIRENKEAVAKNIKIRNSEVNVDLVVQLYEQYCDLTVEVNKLREERNMVANSMKGNMEPSKREELVETGKHLKERLAGFESELAVLLEKLQEEGQRLPNMTHPDVPLGSEEAAVVQKVVGSKVELRFPARDHLELGQLLDLIDFGAAAEVSGQKFYYLKNEAVLLELGLVNWALAEVIKKGFVPLSTPDLVRSTVVEKCGFQPRGQNTQIYSVEGTDLCLAGTAEIPVAGMYMDKIVPDGSLPSKLVAFSHCFRTEAGAAGSATRGLYRVHQFSKVEMFILCRPEESDAFHRELISIEEELFTSLGLHFKIIDMPTEDLGAPAYRKYDVEAWMPGLGRYGEISSASNCTDYQSRRLNIRYRQVQVPKPKKGKGQPTRFVHTLNATACAVPRLIIAILENFQQEDGSVLVPDVLQPYMGGLKVISPKST